ncbi:MAG: DCC1-like thiol-disulfide oxidoreductase family protein [Cyanobacteria bacterium J06623_7]
MTDFPSLSNTERLWQNVKAGWSLDLRSLALLRIGLACLIMINLASSLNQGSAFVFWLRVLGLCSAGCLFLGYRTTIASIYSWGILIFLHHQDSGLIASGETLLCWLTFWSLFLPLGACFSCDGACNTNAVPPPFLVFTGGTVGMLGQFFLLGGIALNQAQVNPGTWLLSLLSCLLFLCPWRLGLGRLAAIAGWLMGGWLVIPTPEIWLLLGLGFLPSIVWELAEQHISSKEITGLVINYDRDCGFCKKVVHLLRTWLILPGVPLREAQDNPSILADMEQYNSWVIEDYQGRRYFKWQGIAYVVSISPLWWWLAPVLRMAPLMKLGTKIYEEIANNRRLMGNFTRPLQFRPYQIQTPLLVNLWALGWLWIVIWGNLGGWFYHSTSVNLPSSAREATWFTTKLIRLLHLDLPTTIFLHN